VTKLSLLLNLSATNWKGSILPRKTAAARRNIPKFLLQSRIINLQTANSQSLKLKFDSYISNEKNWHSNHVKLFSNARGCH
jgi:hypothetical protein